VGPWGSPPPPSVGPCVSQYYRNVALHAAQSVLFVSLWTLCPLPFLAASGGTSNRKSNTAQCRVQEQETVNCCPVTGASLICCTAKLLKLHGRLSVFASWLPWQPTDHNCPPPPIHRTQLCENLSPATETLRPEVRRVTEMTGVLCVSVAVQCRMIVTSPVD
jgi:hypothetical protein